MWRLPLSSLLSALLLFTGTADAKNYRSSAVRDAFKWNRPCPSLEARIRPGTAGGRRGACPGYEIDHIVPLCAGGADSVWNLQWLSIELHRIKTRDDVRACRIFPDLGNSSRKR